MIHLFLAVTFSVHLIAFLVLYIKKNEPRFVLLCGTFACLTVIYTLKWQGLAPALGSVPLLLVLRILALLFTGAYLYVSWPRIAGFLRRLKSAKESKAADS